MATRKAGTKRPRPLSIHSVASNLSEPWNSSNTEGENAINVAAPVAPRDDIRFQEVYDLLMADSKTVPYAARLKEAYNIANPNSPALGQMESGYNEYIAAGMYGDIATNLLRKGAEKAGQKVQRLANKSMREARLYGYMYGGSKSVKLTRRRRSRRTQKQRKQRRFCSCNSRQ